MLKIRRYAVIDQIDAEDSDSEQNSFRSHRGVEDAELPKAGLPRSQDAKATEVNGTSIDAKQALYEIMPQVFKRDDG